MNRFKYPGLYYHRYYVVYRAKGRPVKPIRNKDNWMWKVIEERMERKDKPPPMGKGVKRILFKSIYLHKKKEKYFEIFWNEV